MQPVEIKTAGGHACEVNLVTPRYSTGKGHYCPVYDESALDFIAESIKERPEKGHDCIIMITGERRTGKSTVGAHLARRINPDFPLSHVSYKLEEFNDNISNAPYADHAKSIFPQMMLDEAGVDLFNQEWWNVVQRNFTKKLEVIGIKNLIIYLVLPHRTKLNASIREDMVFIWLNTVLLDGQRGLCEYMTSHPNKYDRAKWWNTQFVFTFPPIVDEWWTEGYTTKKRIFVDEMAASSLLSAPVGGKRHDELLHQRRVLVRLLNEKGMSQYKIAGALGIDRSTVGSILNDTKQRQGKVGPL